MYAKLLKSTILAGGLLLAGFAPAVAGPKVATTAGKTQGEWAAAWWQWMVSIPAPENPQGLQGEVDCTLNQSGPVWFLAAAQAGTFERSCRVKAGKPLFFPVLNAIFTNAPGENLTIAEKRVFLDDFISDLVPGPAVDFGLPGTRACKLFATVDGEPVLFGAAIARTQSPAFQIDTGDDPVGLPANRSDAEAVTDGFWVILPPLPAGEHTLRFGGSWCEFDSAAVHPVFEGVDVTYHLTVGK